MPKGVELDKHLNTASLDVVVAAIAQAAATLAAAANRCTFHRDLKPSNLFWLDGRTVVGDWGLVDMPDNLELTRSGQKLGSVYYIAPEMLLDAGNAISGPADVYSLAKTLWVLATRAAFPLQGEHRLDVPGLLLTTYRPHERGYLLDHLIDRSSRHEPAQRLTMAEIRDELAAWLALPSTMGEQPDLKDIAARIAAQTAPGRAEWVARQERLDSLKALLDRLRAQLEPLRLMAEEAGLAHPRVGHGNLLQNAQREFWPDEPVMLEGMTNYVTLSAGDSGQPWLCSGFAVDVIHQGPVRLFAGHYVQGQLNGKFELAWSDGRKASLGTALEQAAVDDLINGLTSSFEAALEAFIRVA